MQSLYSAAGLPKAARFAMQIRQRMERAEHVRRFHTGACQCSDL